MIDLDGKEIPNRGDYVWQRQRELKEALEAMHALLMKYCNNGKWELAPLASVQRGDIVSVNNAFSKHEIMRLGADEETIWMSSEQLFFIFMSKQNLRDGKESFVNFDVCWNQDEIVQRKEEGHNNEGLITYRHDKLVFKKTPNINLIRE